MKVVFFGTPQIASIVLEKLINTPYKPTLVITAPDTKIGRGQKYNESQVKQTANKHNIKVLTPKVLDENFQLQITNLKFDLAILVAYGQLLPKWLLEIPKFGFVNVHPSLLPKFRGPSPIQSAILSGEEKTGVSIMLLDEEVDHGPVLSQKEIEITSSDTTETLSQKLATIGASLLLETLPKYLKGEIKPQNQDHQKATFTEKIKKADGFIDPNHLPDNDTLYRKIRAYYPWPGVYTELKIKNGELKIKLLPGDPLLLQPAGKKPMDTKSFLNGYPQTKEFIEKIS